MKVETTTVTKIQISDIKGLDPITVFLEDLAPRQGKATINCYNESWTSYWGGMGDRTIAEFILSCDENYLAKNFGDNIDHSLIDLENMAEYARKLIIKERRNGDLDQERARQLFETAEELEGIENDAILFQVHGGVMHDIFGDEWWHSVPTVPNHKYTYLCKILSAVQEALKETV